MTGVGHQNLNSQKTPHTSPSRVSYGVGVYRGYFENNRAGHPISRLANIQFSKWLMTFGYDKKKCLMYYEMIKKFQNFCLICWIYIAYIKQKSRLKELKWVTIK